MPLLVFPRVQVFTVPAHSFVLPVDALLNPLKDWGIKMCVGFVYREGSKNSQKWGDVSKSPGWPLAVDIETIATHRDGLSRVSGYLPGSAESRLGTAPKGLSFLWGAENVGKQKLQSASSCRGPRWSTHNSPTLTWRLTTISNLSSRESSVFFWLPKALASVCGRCMHSGAHTYTPNKNKSPF